MRCALSFLLLLAAAPPAAAEDAAPPKMDCRACHTSDTPTKAKPALRKCPRKKAPRIHPLDEAKETLRFDGGDRGPVTFSHREHAAMAEMDGGCASCHHYMESRPIEKCAACHASARKRDDVGKPDATAALHRLCIECHRALDATTADCSFCHSSGRRRSLRRLPETIAGTKPFPHAAHVKDYGVACASCHKQESCASCHGVRPAGLKSRADGECVKCHASP
jgi:hypothetical protein